MNASQVGSTISRMLIYASCMSHCYASVETLPLRLPQANSALCPQRDGKWVPAKVRWRSAAGSKGRYGSLHFAWVVAKCIVVTRVCVSVCLSAAACLHYCTNPDVTWGIGRGCPLVVHYWADLQLVHGLRCYGNITRTRNVSEYMLVLALCLVPLVDKRGVAGKTVW